MRTLVWVAVVLATGTAAFAAEKSGEHRPTKIWNRTGPLGETPKHVTEALPLSDQDNKGGWAKFEPMSDEFEGRELDPSKWTVGMYWWKGRQPAAVQRKERRGLRRQAAPDDAEGETAPGDREARL